MLLLFKKILDNDGILAFNLRAESFYIYNDILESLKQNYTSVFEINFRPCSGLILCC